MRRYPPVRRLFAAAPAAALLLCAGAATAQSCAEEGAAVSRCRFLLSEPRVFTVDAGARLARAASGSATLAVTVDGRPCRAARSGWGSRIRASCRVALAAGEHVVETVVSGPASPGAVYKVRLRPSPRLAELPRESATLNPPRGRGLFGLFR